MCVAWKKRIFEECIPGENLSQVTNKKSQEEKVQITQQKNDQRKWKHVSKKKYINVLETFEDIQGGRRNIQGQEEEQAYKGILREARENPEKTKNQWEDRIHKERSCQKC